MLLILEGTKAAFTFTLHLDSFEVNDVPCDTLTACDPYFNLFCLREGRSYESHTTDDCPLGVSNSRLDKPGTVVIQSSSDWKVIIAKAVVNLLSTSEDNYGIR